MGCLRDRQRLRLLPLLTMILTPSMPGCLITSSEDIPPEENFPPSIVSDLAAPQPRYPIEEIVTLDRDVDESLTFRVIVRDPNINDELKYAVFESFDPVVIIDSGDVGGEGEHERPFSFTLENLARYPRGLCHKIELRVSRSFETDGSPSEDGDIGSAVWWINSLAEDGSATDLSTCPD